MNKESYVTNKAIDGVKMLRTSEFSLFLFVCFLLLLLLLLLLFFCLFVCLFVCFFVVVFFFFCFFVFFVVVFFFENILDCTVNSIS